MPLAHASDILFVRSETTVVTPSRRLCNHEKRERASRQRVEDRRELCAVTCRQPGRAARTIPAETLSGPSLGGGIARKDKHRARRPAGGLHHHQRGVRLLNTSEILHPRILKELDIILRRLSRPKYHGDCIRQTRQQGLAPVGVLARRELRLQLEGQKQCKDQ